MKPVLSTVPPHSIIYQRLPGASFYDCYALDIAPSEVVAHTPGWLNALALKVELSVFKRARTVSVSTVVHTHNALGRFYMLFVAPLHRRIVPATLRRARFAG